MGVDYGLLTLTNTSGITFVGGANGDAGMAVTGSIANLNAALNGLVYRPNSFQPGPETLDITFTDSEDGFETYKSVPINVAGLVAPTITAPASASVSQSGSLTFSPANGDAISVADAAAGSNSVSLTLSAMHGGLTLASAAGLTFTRGANGSGSFTVSGPVSNLNNALSGLTYAPNTNYAGPDSLSISVSDPSDGQSGSGSVAITVSPLAPSITAPLSASLTQNGSFVFAGGNTISTTDANPGAVDSLSLSVTHGTLTLATIAGLSFTSGSNGAASFTVSGTVANLNAALSALTYAPTTNYTGADSIAISISDPGDGLSASKNVSLTINALPAPTIGAPASATITQNSSLVLSSANGNAITVTDSAAGSNSDSLSLSVTHGTLTLATIAGLAFTSGTNGSASFTVTGTISNLNAALNGLTYAPTANYTGPDSLSISVSDPSDGQSGSGSVAITISPLAPSITAPLSASLTQNGSFVFAGGNTISTTDANPGAVDSLSLSVTHGTLTLATIAGLSFTSGSNGAASFTVSGTVANLNAALSALTYAPTTNYTGADSIAISISDPGDGLSASKNVSLTINALPAPTIGAPASATITQNSSLVLSSANGNAITVTDSAAGSNSDSLSLSVTHGTLTLATIAGLAFTSGTNGSASFTVTGTISNLNAALNGLTYAPTANYTGSDSLAISITDPGDGYSAAKSVALTVSNSPPAITAPATATLIFPVNLVFAPSKGNGISIADVNAGTTVERLTLTATDGTLLLGSTTGITFTSGANGGASMTIQGTLANINAALNGLTFHPIAIGSASVVLSYTDVATGQLASATINISVVRLVFKPGSVLPGSSPASAAGARSTPSSSTTLASAVTSTSINDSDDENSAPPDALTQWQGLNAAVDVPHG